MITGALVDYTTRCESSDITERPLVWAGFYDSGGTNLGEVCLPQLSGQLDLGHAVLGVSIPFAACPDVADAYVVINHSDGPERLLSATHLIDTGTVVGMTQYSVPFGMDDVGHLDLGEVIAGVSESTLVNSALARIRSERLSRTIAVSFDGAVKAAVDFLTTTEQGRDTPATGLLGDHPGGEDG